MYIGQINTICYVDFSIHKTIGNLTLLIIVMAIIQLYQRVSAMPQYIIAINIYFLDKNYDFYYRKLDKCVLACLLFHNNNNL